VLGVQTVGGFVIIKTGGPGVEITTWADSAEMQPTEFVTVNVNTPPARPLIVLVIPLPVVVVPPGNRVMTHVPEDGNPFSTTLPEGTANVGCVIVPTTGAEGVGGCAGITKFKEGPDRHPSAVVTVKLYVAEERPGIVVLVPDPVVLIVPGYRITVQVPDEGNPVNVTLPVDKVHVGGKIAPIKGAAGIGGCAFITTFPDGEEIHPVELVTVKVYVADGKAETV
jgi:hypothetical protein